MTNSAAAATERRLLERALLVLVPLLLIAQLGVACSSVESQDSGEPAGELSTNGSSGGDTGDGTGDADDEQGVDDTAESAESPLDPGGTDPDLRAAAEAAQESVDQIVSAFNADDPQAVADVLGAGSWVDMNGTERSASELADSLGPALSNIETTLQTGDPEEAMGGFAFPLIDNLTGGGQFEYYLVVVQDESGRTTRIMEVREL